MTGPSWPQVRLGDLGTWYGGGTPSKSRTDFWSQGTVPWLSPKDMGSDTLAGTRDAITSAAVEGSAVRVVPAGSVAVVVRSGILERTLPIALVPFETTLNQDMKAVVPADGVDPRWIAWALRSREQQLLRSCRKAGTTVASIEVPRFLDMTLPLPPVEDQRRIVDLLEDHLSRLAAAESLLHDGVARVAAMRTSWVAKTLATAAPREMATIGDKLIDIRGGWSRGRRHYTDNSHGVPYIKMNNITRSGQLDLAHWESVVGSEDEIARFRVRTGDVLFNSKNSGDLVGKTAVATTAVDGWTFNENIMRLRFQEDLLPDFVGIWFQGSTLRARLRREVSASTNVAAIYAHQLRQMPIWVPSLTVQADIVDDHARMMEAQDRLKLILDEQLRRSRVLRLAVLRVGTFADETDASRSRLEEGTARV